MKHLDSMSDERIMGCNLPTGIPFVYELDEDLKVRHVVHSVPQEKKYDQIGLSSDVEWLFTDTDQVQHRLQGLVLAKKNSLFAKNIYCLNYVTVSRKGSSFLKLTWSFYYIFVSKVYERANGFEEKI